MDGRGTLFLRLDGADPGATFTVEFEGVEHKNRALDAHVAMGRIVELSVARRGHRFRVAAARDGLPPATIPAEGWIELDVLTPDS